MNYLLKTTYNPAPHLKKQLLAIIKQEGKE